MPSHLAHGSVIIFFVLSGYVISYTTSIKKRSIVEYIAARLSRLYSVFFPAILFTALISFVLFYSNPALLTEYTRDKTGLRYFISLIFCNELWFLSAAPLINGVIWSLSYEFWFYIIFGCWLYKLHHKTGILFLIISIIIAGPKILLMFPIWIMGLVAYKLPKPRITAMLRTLLISLMLIISFTLMLTMKQLPYEMNSTKLYWASSFFSDFIQAFFIAAALWLLSVTTIPFSNKNKKIDSFRKIANLTFPIYVFHYPCLVFCRSLFGDANTYSNMWLSLIITLIFCFFIGIYTEKWHYSLKKYFLKLFA